MTVQELINNLEKTPEHLRDREILQAAGEYSVYSVTITDNSVTIN